jgi:LysR family transcriptional activator of nhaA
MDDLNYHHLRYFWMVAREGSVSAAARKLHVAQPTISTQVKELGAALGIDLFQRKGASLVLTEAGMQVYRYASDIFALGRELRESIAGHTVTKSSRLLVGIADVMAKSIAERLLRPVLRMSDELRLVCYEDRHDILLADLALHRLDVVLSDQPASPTAPIRAYNHLLGESGVSLFAKPKLAERLRRRFPGSMKGVPVLLPIEHTSLRGALMKWFEAHDVRLKVRGEFQDTALLAMFGQLGAGVFAAPTIIEKEVETQHRVESIARLAEVRERFYAITVDRRIAHPGVNVIRREARGELFLAKE